MKSGRRSLNAPFCEVGRSNHIKASTSLRMSLSTSAVSLILALFFINCRRFVSRLSHWVIWGLQRGNLAKISLVSDNLQLILPSWRRISSILKLLSLNLTKLALILRNRRRFTLLYSFYRLCCKAVWSLCWILVRRQRVKLLDIVLLGFPLWRAQILIQKFGSFLIFCLNVINLGSQLQVGFVLRSSNLGISLRIVAIILGSRNVGHMIWIFLG